MVIRDLQPFATELRKIQEIPSVFFQNLENAIAFDDTLFPAWLVDDEGNYIVFNGTQLKPKFRNIYDKYKDINVNERRKVIDAFTHTNAILDLCNNTDGTLVIEVSELHSSIQTDIKDTFLYLYESAINHPGFISYVKDNLDEAIRRFTRNNHIEICPFCGLETMTQLKGQARIPLDHWINKDRFPFAAVNFDNLIPIGTKCNDRGVKGTKNVLKDRTQQNRVKTFYPFCNHQGINVNFNFINEPSIDGINDDDWRLNIQPNDNTENEIFEGWDFIFNISTRYTDYIREYPLLRWERDYRDFINIDTDDIEHATSIEEFKENLRQWRRAFPLKKRAGAIVYRAFIDYLINDASDEYLTSLYENFLSWDRHGFM